MKAVVLRVDSPGGSALASEIILDATKRVAKEKPLIVSMGNVAGSGGYYVACGAETIFADSATITASIGVLGGKLVTHGHVGQTQHSLARGATRRNGRDDEQRRRLQRQRAGQAAQPWAKPIRSSSSMS